MSSIILVLTVIGSFLALTQAEYRVFGQASWFMANEICSANGMKVVRIDDQNKNNDVFNFIDRQTAQNGPYWTSGSRLYDDTIWSHAVADHVKYFKWASGEPNNYGGNERCMDFNRNGQWNDRDCSDQIYVLCE